MSFNGSGTFVINSVGNPTVTGTTISSTWANALTADIATGLTLAICKDGQSTTSAAIPFALGLTTPTGYGFTAAGSQALIGYFCKRATVDQSITSNTVLASATNMSFAIAASEEWVADFDWDVGGSMLTTGIKIAVTVPAGATLNATSFASCQTIAVGDNQNARTTTSGADFGFSSASMAGSANSVIRISVWVLNSTNAGTVQLQIAQATSSVTALVLRKGSHMLANRVA